MPRSADRWGILSDERMPWYAWRMLRKVRTPKRKKVTFIFSMDVERGPDYRQAAKVCARLNKEFPHMHGTYFIDAELIERGAPPPAGKHEIGTHGYYHKALGRFWWIEEGELATDPVENLTTATRIITRTYGKPVSFRAPSFSQGPAVSAVLHRLGYKYTSSTPPFSERLFPSRAHDLLEVPLSRSRRPRLVMRPFPVLQYTPLMLSVLREIGPERMVDLSMEILAQWDDAPNPYDQHPCLVFLTHNWEFRKDGYDLLRRYLELLEQRLDITYLPLREYAEKVRR